MIKNTEREIKRRVGKKKEWERMCKGSESKGDLKEELGKEQIVALF